MEHRVAGEVGVARRDWQRDWQRVGERGWERNGLVLHLGAALPLRLLQRVRSHADVDAALVVCGDLIVRHFLDWRVGRRL